MRMKTKTSVAMAIGAGLVATATVWAAAQPGTAKSAAAGAAKATCSMISGMGHAAGNTMSCCHMPMAGAAPKQSDSGAKPGQPDKKMDGMAGMPKEKPKGTASVQGGKMGASCAGM